MKCMKNPITGEIKRVTEAEARKLARYSWVYVSKGEWKRSLRPDYKAVRDAAAVLVKGFFNRRI